MTPCHSLFNYTHGLSPHHLWATAKPPTWPPGKHPCPSAQTEAFLNRNIISPLTCLNSWLNRTHPKSFPPDYSFCNLNFLCTLGSLSSSHAGFLPASDTPSFLPPQNLYTCCTSSQIFFQPLPLQCSNLKYMLPSQKNLSFIKMAKTVLPSPRPLSLTLLYFLSCMSHLLKYRYLPLSFLVGSLSHHLPIMSVLKVRDLSAFSPPSPQWWEQCLAYSRCWVSWLIKWPGR